MKFKRKWLIYLLFAVVAGAGYFGNVALQSHLGRKALKDTGLVVRSLAEASQLAAEEGKLVLAVCSAIWCPSCRKLDQQVFADEAVQRAINNGFVYARVEYESKEGTAFLDRYKLSGFPNLLILKPDGELVHKLSLTFDPETFRQQLAGSPGQ